MPGPPFSIDPFLQLILLLSFTTGWSSQFHTEVMFCVEKYFFLQFLLNLLLDSFLGVSISPILLNGKPLYRHVSAIHDYTEIYHISWRELVFIDFQYTEKFPQVCSPSLLLSP